MRALLAVVAGVLAGLVAGGIWTWAQPSRYRADARVLVRPQSSRVAPAVQALAESSLVATNIQQTLHLSAPPHVSAKIGNGAVLTVSVEAGSRERARQIDAEALVVLTAIVAQRFGAPVHVTATVLDPAHAAKQTSPTPGRNFLITGLAGLGAGLVLAAGLAWPRRARGVATGDPVAERRLKARIDEVTKRERAMARRAGELAAHEQKLDRREEELAAAASRPRPSDHAAARRERDLEKRERELATREAQLEAVAAVPEAEEAPPPLAEVTEPGWNLRTLERLVDEQRASNPAAAEEWTTYLFFLRGHADADGALPASFDGLIADVFGNVPGLLSGRDGE